MLAMILEAWVWRKLPERMAFGHRNLIKKKLEDAEMSFHFNTLTLAIGTGISLELDPRIKVRKYHNEKRYSAL